MLRKMHLINEWTTLKNADSSTFSFMHRNVEHLLIKKYKNKIQKQKDTHNPE